jgi:hypothetical protein
MNPFEPPRTSDLDAPSATGDARLVPEQAIDQLVRSGPWARWTARLTLASLVVSVLHNVISFPKAKNAAEAAGLVAGLVLAVPLTIIFLVNFRNYAGHAERLAQGERRAVEGLADAQRAVFKTMGVLTLIALVLGALVLVAGIFIGVLAATRGARP